MFPMLLPVKSMPFFPLHVKGRQVKLCRRSRSQFSPAGLITAVCWRGAVFPVGRLDAIRGHGGKCGGGRGEGEFRQAAPRGSTAGGRRTRAPVGRTSPLTLKHGP